ERHRAQIDFSELAEDDLVVHLEHGVGRFLGLTKVGTAGPTDRLAVRPYQDEQHEVLAIEFADEAKLYVPFEQAYLVSRYVGPWIASYAAMLVSAKPKSQCALRSRR